MRLLILVLATSVVVLGLAGAAAAHSRDPFVPLVSEADASGPGVDAPGDVAPAPVQPAPDNERIADTGAPIAQFAGLALALMAIGAGMLAIASLRRPESFRAIRRRDGSVA